LIKQNWSAAKSHRLFASARRTTLYAMPPAAGQPAALQGTEPGQGHLRGESVPRHPKTAGLDNKKTVTKHAKYSIHDVK